MRIILGLLLVIVFGGIYLFWEQEGKIDFVKHLPLELIHCGDSVNKNHLKYIVLKEWLKSNKTGWKYTPASYVSVNEFEAPKISIMVLKKVIVINYQLKNNEWTQVVKPNNGLLLKSCRKRS